MPLPRHVTALVAAMLALALPAAAVAFDPELETKNFAKTAEREQYITLTPEFQLRLQQANLDNETEVVQIVQADPERNFSGNVCANGGNECAGDVRFYDWPDQGFAIRKPVLFTARNGSTLSGHVWATRDGLGPRPAVVITTGSVQAPERLYWGTAAMLAKHGYVVLTYDTQGQGRSDTFGEGADLLDGVPSQSGRPFYDGTEDALDFMLSTASKPYDPRPSCTSGTDHSEKQDRRAAAGLNAAFNPLADLVDPTRVGNRRPFARRRRCLLRRPARPARRRDCRLGQPPRPEHEPGPGRGPGRSADLHLGLVAATDRPRDHQAGDRDLQRLRDRADAEHLRP